MLIVFGEGNVRWVAGQRWVVYSNFSTGPLVSLITSMQVCIFGLLCHEWYVEPQLLNDMARLVSKSTCDIFANKF
jgi:hypothetical protein